MFPEVNIRVPKLGTISWDERGVNILDFGPTPNTNLEERKGTYKGGEIDGVTDVTGGMTQEEVRGVDLATLSGGRDKTVEKTTTLEGKVGLSTSVEEELFSLSM